MRTTNPTAIDPTTETVTEWLAEQTTEPLYLLAVYRALFDAEDDARALLGYRLPAIAAEQLTATDGPLKGLLARALPGLDWRRVADALADRRTRAESRDLLRAAVDGMRVRPGRRAMARAG